MVTAGVIVSRTWLGAAAVALAASKLVRSVTYPHVGRYCGWFSALQCHFFAISFEISGFSLFQIQICYVNLKRKSAYFQIQFLVVI